MKVPRPPEIGAGTSTPTSVPATPQPNETVIDENAKPVLVETGVASWYGPPYHNRRGANGEVYDMHALTAAHRTLPLNSIARVTNLKTGSSAMVRITDRGPFVEGRILDLSMEAAKQTDVWRAGLAQIKLEVMHTPVPIETGGRWCVQYGAFKDEDAANRLTDKLTRKYHTAKVLQFAGPTKDWWVRIRVLDDQRGRAEEVIRDVKADDVPAWLVRLD